MCLLQLGLVEIPTGKGLMLLSQLTIGENLPTMVWRARCWPIWSATLDLQADLPRSCAGGR
jgi:hypothetical protein